MSRMLALFSVLCLGVVALFAFFAVLGEVAPGDVLWLTVLLAVSLLVAAVHAWSVRRNLHTHGNQEFFRSLNRLRERRGF
jgi:membrane protein implicated in regulation of membrane protease activity